MDPLRLSVQRPPRSTKPRRAKPDFSIPVALERADRIMGGPHAGHTPRIEGRGALVHRFVLPLELAQPQNRTRQGQQWALASLKAKVFKMLWLQHPTVRPEPLPGRPMVRLVRFSTVEPDALADWGKMAVDCLCLPRPPKVPGGRKKLGLGLLRDDAPRFVEIVTWWEKAKQGEGLALIEVWTGGQ